MSYTEILNNLNVTTGFLNYHLENVGDLISKNDDGQYYLTSFGEAALTLISNVEMPEKRPQHFKILNKRISWKYVTLSIISILAISNIFILYDNNLMYTKEYTIVKNKVAQNRILFNKIISIINSTTSNCRIDFLIQRNLLEYTRQISNNYEEILYLTGSNNEKLLQVKNSIDVFSSFINDWTIVQITYLIFTKAYNYSNVTVNQIYSLEKISEDLANINKFNIFYLSGNTLSMDQNELLQVYTASLKLEVDVNYARSAFSTGTFFMQP
jgi:hypothetical protein